VTEEMVAYYAQRAAEYERVYASPRWQEDLEEIRGRIRAVFAGRRLFEVACGTGYWTRHAAERALHVHATDVNDDTLVLARAKTYRARVTFERRDAYAPATGSARFDAGLAALWLSHVDLGRMDEFLRAFHSHLEPGAVVFMFDERLGDDRERRAPASRTDATGNRYEMRRLESGERFEIVKNAFDRPRLDRLIGPYATGLTYQELRGFWTLQYAVA
jgi:demethylmenaquinone methyltransferase/2-methoxy-6-polyprenyl-1,4-benzoquinol methylase